MNVDVSIVIPFLNEQNRLGATIDTIREFFSSQSLSYEIILVDDGSTDATVSVVIEPRRTAGPLTVVRHEHNQGKGAAVATGAAVSTGRYIFFTDADLSTPISEFPKLYALREHPIVIGSRRNISLVQKRQSKIRELFGLGGNALIRHVFALPYRDTQCGFKLFHADIAKQLFRNLTLTGWGFDFDIMYQAKRAGIIAPEVPVVWAHNNQSKLRPGFDHIATLCGLIYLKLVYFFKLK